MFDSRQAFAFHGKLRDLWPHAAREASGLAKTEADRHNARMLRLDAGAPGQAHGW